MIVDGDLVRTGGVADQIELAISARAKEARHTVDVANRFTDQLIRHAAAFRPARAAKPAHKMRAAIVERQPGDAARCEFTRQQISTIRIKDGRAACAVQKHRGATRAALRLVQQAGQLDAVGRRELH